MSYTGCVRLTLAPKQAAVYIPDFGCKPGYRFDKRHDSPGAQRNSPA
jgi:hypothetical protein